MLRPLVLGLLALCALAPCQRPPIEYMIGGARSPFHDADFSRDGRWIVAVNRFGAYIFDTQTGKLIKTLKPSFGDGTPSPTSVRFSATPLYLALGYHGGIELYSPGDWTQRDFISVPGNIAPQAIEFNGSETLLAVHQWLSIRLSDHTHIGYFDAMGQPIGTQNFGTYTGLYVYAGGGLYDQMSGAFRGTRFDTRYRWKGSYSEKYVLKIDGDNTKIAKYPGFANAGFTDDVFDLGLAYNWRWSDHGDWVTAARFGQVFDLAVWNLDRPNERLTWYGQYGGLLRPFVDRGEYPFGKVRNENTNGFAVNYDVHMFRMPDLAPVHDFTPHVGGAPKVAFSGDGQYFASGAVNEMWEGGAYPPSGTNIRGKGVRIWRAGTGVMEQILPVEDSVLSLNWCNGSQDLVIGFRNSTDGWVEHWQRGPTGMFGFVSRVVTRKADTVDVSPNGLVATASASLPLQVHRLDGTVVANNGPFAIIAKFAPNGDWILANTTAGVKLLPTSTAGESGAKSLGLGPCFSIDWSPDGQYALALGGPHDSSTLYVIPTGKARAAKSRSVLVGNRGRIVASPDGRAIALYTVSSTDRAIRLYRFSDLGMQSSFTEEVFGPTEAGVSASPYLAFSPDGKKIVVGRHDGVIVMMGNPLAVKR